MKILKWRTFDKMPNSISILRDNWAVIICEIFHRTEQSIDSICVNKGKVWRLYYEKKIDAIKIGKWLSNLPWNWWETNETNIWIFIFTLWLRQIIAVASNDRPKQVATHLRLNFMVVFNWQGNLIFSAIEWERRDNCEKSWNWCKRVINSRKILATIIPPIGLFIELT